MTDRAVIFSISGYEALQNDLVEALAAECGQIERSSFPDGERYQRLLSPVDGRDVIIVGGTVNDTATLCLYDLACAVAKLGARRLSLVVPYFGYSTMERAVKWGEVVTAKTRARLLSSVPPASYGNRVFLVDLHSEGIPHYFESGVRAVHIYAKGILSPVIQELGGDDFVLGSTDSGRAKWVESLANDLGVEAAFIMKRRISGAETRVTALNAEVTGRTVVIYDDMIRSGGSLIGAAEAYRDAGAARLFAVCTHGVFTEGAFGRLKASGLFDTIVATDTHPEAIRHEADGLRLVSTAGLFTEHLRA
jgi:ribose-phosphate pyrophosphokinase